MNCIFLLVYLKGCSFFKTRYVYLYLIILKDFEQKIRPQHHSIHIWYFLYGYKYICIFPPLKKKLSHFIQTWSLTRHTTPMKTVKIRDFSDYMMEVTIFMVNAPISRKNQTRIESNVSSWYMISQLTIQCNLQVMHTSNCRFTQTTKSFQIG